MAREGTQKKVGRPGANRAKEGRVRAAVRPDIKTEAEEIVEKDGRVRSLSHMIESALAYYIRAYTDSAKASHNGIAQIDEQSFPILPKR